jgi:O-antigen ligase/polysaccharide polymerase Wzy-like membrane protein
VTRTQRTVLLTVATAAIVIAANASQGAYFSQSWGWVALAFLVPTTVLLLLERATAPGRLRIAFVCLLGAYAAWIALSSIWSVSSPATIREVERMLVYVAVSLAVAFVLRRGDATGVLAGISVGTSGIAAYALAARTFPDRFHSYDDPFASYRLAQPLGYWNALGLLGALGIIVTFGFVAHSRRSWTSVVAAAMLPVLATTLYFTFSRGAWGALGVGLVATIVLDPRRLRYLWSGCIVAVPVVLCVAYGSRQDALTTEGSRAADAAREGHRMAAVVLVATIGASLAAWAVHLVARRVNVSKRRARVVDGALAVVAIVAVVAALVSVGGPAKGFSEVKSRFSAEPPGGTQLNERLFSISGNGRAPPFRVAWHAARSHPLVGNGAGTFEYIWYRHRPTLLVVRDAHSLYLEALAEVGVVGLALLVAALVVLLGGGVRARRVRFAAAGTAALTSWAVAAAVDWHWEMVGVTLTAFLAGAGALVASERPRARPLGSRARGPLVVLGIVLSVAATISLVGNQALFAAKSDVGRKDWAAARRDARRAHALLPWSAEPDLVLGDAAAGSGDRTGAVSAYRDAIARDPESWAAWLRLGQVARGAERVHAYAHVHQLNPRDRDLPGE